MLSACSLGSPTQAQIRDFTAEPADRHRFWHRYIDRLFMRDQLYPRLIRQRAILDIGARLYDVDNVDLFNATKRPAYYQLEPYPALNVTYRNDRTLTCTMQEVSHRYPELCGFFDTVLDLGVLGAISVPFTPEESVAYLEALRFVLEPGGLYVLKTDGGEADKRLAKVQAIAFAPYFRKEPALGFAQAKLSVGRNPAYTFTFYRHVGASAGGDAPSAAQASLSNSAAQASLSNSAAQASLSNIMPTTQPNARYAPAELDSAWSISLATIHLERDAGDLCSSLIPALREPLWVPIVGPQSVLGAEFRKWGASDLFADPFLAPDFATSQMFLFFEVLVQRGGAKDSGGAIACAVAPLGWHRWRVSLEWSILGEVLFHPPLQHLSYPQVFSHGGTWYMVPETNKDGGVFLYSASKFPLVWHRVRRLLAGRYVDATLQLRDGVWWLLANPLGSVDTVHAFCINGTLEAGSLVPHAHQPVFRRAARDRAASINGGNNSRGAGRVVLHTTSQAFAAWGGFRLAQDNRGHKGVSEPFEPLDYGRYGVQLNEVMSISPHVYEERTCGHLLRPATAASPCTWNHDAMHHIDVHVFPNGHVLVAADGNRLFERRHGPHHGCEHTQILAHSRSSKADDAAERHPQHRCEFHCHNEVFNLTGDLADLACHQQVAPRLRSKSPVYYWRHGPGASERSRAAREAVCSKAPGTHWHGVTFGSHGVHSVAAQNLCREAILAGADTCRAMRVEDLPSRYTSLLTTHGIGFWSWKPLVIWQRMQDLPDDDVLLYFDRELPITRHRRLDALFCIGQNVVGGVGLTHQVCLTDRSWVKRSVVDLFGVRDNVAYLDTVGLLGGLNVWRRGAPLAERLLAAWLELASWTNLSAFRDALPHAPCGKHNPLEQDPEFCAHRHDQAVLGMLAKSMGAKTFPFPISAHAPGDIWAWEAGYCDVEWPMDSATQLAQTKNLYALGFGSYPQLESYCKPNGWQPRPATLTDFIRGAKKTA